MSKPVSKPLSRDVAIKEVDKWLEFKRFSDDRRKEKQGYIDEMIQLFESGSLVLQEDHSITMKLLFDVGSLKELKFKPRLTVSDLNQLKNPNKGQGNTGLLTSYITALQVDAVNQAFIEKLDMEDFNNAGVIALFFM